MLVNMEDYRKLTCNVTVTVMKVGRLIACAYA